MLWNCFVNDLRLGLRHIDTAEAYQNEAEIGWDGFLAEMLPPYGAGPGFVCTREIRIVCTRETGFVCTRDPRIMFMDSALYLIS